MNNAKLWLVVPPKVGLPMFLGAVAIGSFAVHVAVLSKTTWYQDYLLGEELGSSASAALTVAPGANTAKASFSAQNLDGAQEITIVMPDGTTAQAILKPNEILAAADAPPRVVASD